MPPDSAAPTASRQASASASASPSPAPQPEGQQLQGKRIKITSSSDYQRPTPAPPSQQPASSATPPPLPKQEEPLEAFEDRTLGAVFKLTLNEDRKHDIHGGKLIYLPGLRSELEEEGRDLRIETTILDQALVEAASTAGQPPLDYLLPCWKRISRLYKGFRRAKESDPKFGIISEARRLCMSYCVFAVTMPEMFGCVSCLFYFLTWPV